MSIPAPVISLKSAGTEDTEGDGQVGRGGRCGRGAYRGTNEAGRRVIIAGRFAEVRNFRQRLVLSIFYAV